MKTLTKTALALSALVLGLQAMAQIVIYEYDNYRGRSLVVDRDMRNLDRRGVGTARSIGEGTRERLSADVWRLLDAPLPPLDDDHPATLLSRATALQERFSALAGLAAENMGQTSGWRFHDLGRRIERAAETCRLARAFAGDDASVDDLATLLDRPSQKTILNQQLAALNHPRRELAPALHAHQIVLRHAT